MKQKIGSAEKNICEQGQAEWIFCLAQIIVDDYLPPTLQQFASFRFYLIYGFNASTFMHMVAVACNRYTAIRRPVLHAMVDAELRCLECSHLLNSHFRLQKECKTQ